MIHLSSDFLKIYINNATIWIRTLMIRIQHMRNIDLLLKYKLIRFVKRNLLPEGVLMFKRKLFFVILLITITIASNVWGMDVLKYYQGEGINDVKLAQKIEVLTTALEKSQDRYGDYKIVLDAPMMNNFRATMALKEGTELNVYISLENGTIENESIPIRIPVRRGLMSYRLILTTEKNLPLFKNVSTLEDLKKILVGSKHSWQLTKILKNEGFDIITTPNYNTIFDMLSHDRFVYLLRGVNEIFQEKELRSESNPDLVVEPNLLIYLPTAIYVFVSKTEPRLAERLEYGLNVMVKDGSLKAIFDKYYLQFIEQADIENRTVIEIDNHFMLDKASLERKELWFTPGE